MLDVRVVKRRSNGALDIRARRRGERCRMWIGGKRRRCLLMLMLML